MESKILVALERIAVSLEILPLSPNPSRQMIQPPHLYGIPKEVLSAL